jgi:HTH-type transcriptional regulator/antitoxin HigA
MRAVVVGIARIQDATEHSIALAEIERLWGAKLGSPDGHRLEALMIVVDAYEREQWPDEDAGRGAANPPD